MFSEERPGESAYFHILRRLLWYPYIKQILILVLMSDVYIRRMSFVALNKDLMFWMDAGEFNTNICYLCIKH